jgi:hypothetical protein
MTIILNGTTGVTFPNGVTMSDGTSAPVTVAQGGTGANTASAARTALGTNDAANITTGAVAIANGGTGQTTRQAAMDALAGAVTAGRYLRGDGTDVIMDTLKAADMTGTIAVANGGTGATTLTTNNVLLGNGTSALQAVAPGTSGNILTSNGTTWTSAAPPSSTPTTAQVLSATAGATAGAVGTYAWLSTYTNQGIGADSTRAGSSFDGYAGIVNDGGNPNTGYLSWQGGSRSGTWRAMGATIPGGLNQSATLFLRIS